MMDNLSKTVYYNNLLSIYGELLATSQKDVLESYYFYNLSISEIADEKGISRAAVDDAIKKGISKLDEYEKTLKLFYKKETISNELAKIKSLTQCKEIIDSVLNIENEVK